MEVGYSDFNLCNRPVRDIIRKVNFDEILRFDLLSFIVIAR